jgi:WD40 repeat protein
MKQSDGAAAEPENQSSEQEQKKPAASTIVLPDTIEESIEVDTAAISLDGKYLAMQVKKNSKPYLELKIMDTSSGSIIHSVDWHDEWGGAMGGGEIKAVSTKGDCVVIKSDSYLFIYNIQNRETKDIRSSNNLDKYPMAFSGDGKYLAHGCYSKQFGTDDGCIKIINTIKGNELFSISVKKCSFIAYSYDSRYIATASDNEIILWDARNGSKLYSLEKDDRDKAYIAFSHDGNCLATSFYSKIIKIWETKSGNLLLQFGKPQDGTNNFVCFSPNDKAIVACFGSGLVDFINSETGEILQQLNGGKNLKWASYSSDGKKLISYSENSIKIWGNE